MPLILIPILFLLMPLVEIGVFILVGSEIGIGWTLALVVASMILGAVLLRRQSFRELQAARAEARAGRVPERELVHGAMIVLAGILLMVPGFVSDAAGLLLFVPPVREAIWRRMRSRVTVRTGGGFPAGPAGPAMRRPGVVDLSDGEFERRGDPSSPWRAVADDDDRPPRPGSADGAGPNRTLH